ncbi:hypothetical protein KP509_1Z221200 [Ceratopteris richardii]|nr:hypothetical protein KP509_1Z221200 [Ceratopteris richardii]
MIIAAKLTAMFSPYGVIRELTIIKVVSSKYRLCIPQVQNKGTSSYQSIERFFQSNSKKNSKEEHGFESTTIEDVLSAKGVKVHGACLFCTIEDSIYNVGKTIIQHNVEDLLVVKRSRKDDIVGDTCFFQLEDVCMAENESVDVYVTCIKDLKEQLANIDEIILDASLISTLLKGLPESFQSFATKLRLVAKGNPNIYAFDEVVSLLLQEEQSRVNRSGLIEGMQALTISQKGKSKHGSALGSSKQKPQTSTSTHSSNYDDLQKTKRCKYCQKPNHTIDECRKLAKCNKKEKESGMSIVENSANAKTDEANMAQDFWACVVTCHYDASLHSKCMVLSEAESD